MRAMSAASSVAMRVSLRALGRGPTVSRVGLALNRFAERVLDVPSRMRVSRARGKMIHCAAGNYRLSIEFAGLDCPGEGRCRSRVATAAFRGGERPRRRKVAV